MKFSYRSVGAFLTGMLPRTSFEINVNGMDNVEEVLYNRDLLVHSSRWNCAFGTI